MEKLYGVKGVKDVYLGWNLKLLPEDEAKKFEKYKQEEEQAAMEARDDAGLKAIRSTPTAVRLKRWATATMLGRNELSELMKKGEIKFPPRGVEPEYKFFIPSDEEIIINERQYEELKQYAYRPIAQTLRPGETKARNIYEGFLHIRELTEDQAKKYLAK